MQTDYLSLKGQTPDTSLDSSTCEHPYPLKHKRGQTYTSQDTTQHVQLESGSQLFEQPFKHSRKGKQASRSIRKSQLLKHRSDPTHKLKKRDASQCESQVSKHQSDPLKQKKKRSKHNREKREAKDRGHTKVSKTKSGQFDQLPGHLKGKEGKGASEIRDKELGPNTRQVPEICFICSSKPEAERVACKHEVKGERRREENRDKEQLKTEALPVPEICFICSSKPETEHMACIHKGGTSQDKELCIKPSSELKTSGRESRGDREHTRTKVQAPEVCFM
eukprot:TRINITY_DN5696_c0_g1_i1.p1 TRINITY_DN5696_c0_g1~~TRINITY_DN5696_c0_g1_i1.p1  ORF type:complete len:278 (+),score=41.74 TRINITY_DN5696_c0_g1_i1:73-906(+)